MLSPRSQSAKHIWLILRLVPVLLVIDDFAQARQLAMDVVPTNQTVMLTINADTSDYSGSTLIDLEVKAVTDSFSFHAERIQFDSLSLKHNKKSIANSFTRGENGLVSVHCAVPLALGKYSLTIDFTNAFDTQAVGLYRVVTEGNGYTFTQFEENDARKAFPCFDEPIFKIPFSVTLKVPQEHLAIANTSIEKESSKDGWKTVVFRETKPLPTYLVAIATGPLETVNVPGMKIPTRIVTVKGKLGLTDFSIKTTPPLMAAFEKYFDSPYPYDKLDLIAVPEFWAGAMENAGAITFRETILLRDPQKLTLSQRRSTAGVIAHELAHMWFGDLVTMAWWDDLWLNESFATWMGNKVCDEVFPEYEVGLNEIGSIHGAMNGDARPSTQQIRQPTGSTDNLLSNIGVIYNKGQAVLMMFEEWMGADLFQKGIRLYLKKHAWGNATADDLWAALSEASGREIGPTMNTFIEQPGVPLISVNMTSTGEIEINQSRFSNYGDTVGYASTLVWQVPMTVKYYDGNSVRTHSLLLTEKKQSFKLPNDGSVQWVLPTADAGGYYRWWVAPKQLEAIAGSFTLLSTRDKIGFINNLSAMLDAGGIGGDQYVKALYNFSSDHDPAIIEAVLDGIETVDAAFISDADELSFAPFLQKIFAPSLQHIGLSAKTNEPETVSRIRPFLISTLAIDGKDQSLIAYADSMADLYLAGKSDIDPSLISTFLDIAATTGDSILWDTLRLRFETATIPSERSQYLSTLSAFRNGRILDKALEYTLTGPLRPQERFTIPFSIAAISDAHRDMIFEWMMRHYDDIAARIPPSSLASLTRYAGGCSRARLDKAHEFFAQPEHRVEGTELRLLRVTESVEECLDLRGRESAAVLRYLSEAVK